MSAVLLSQTRANIAESVVAWGYHVAGAALGSFLGLKQGIMR